MTKRRTPRRDATEGVLAAGRELSTAAILYHAVLSEKLGLGSTEEKALELIQRFGRLTAGELPEQRGLAPPSVPGLVNRLEKKGFVRRAADPADGRRVRVELVPERMQAFVPLFVDLVTRLEALCAEYSTEELETVARFLREAASAQHAAAAKLEEPK